MKLTLQYIGKLHEQPDWSFPTHNHKLVSEVILVIKGEGVVIIAGERYPIQEGDLLVYNREVIHEEYSSHANPLATFYCGISHPEASALLSPERCPVMKTKHYKPTIQALFDLLYVESREQQEHYRETTEHLLSSLYIWIQRLSQQNAAPAADQGSESLAIRIKEYLDLHYLQHLTLQDIAAAFHMNPYYISHVFHRQYADSPIHYILVRRMAEAKQLLVSTDMKISAIASLLGYENANYFTILFTRLMKESPTQFRKKELQKRVNLN